jgi:hypothetical protein
MPDSLIKEAEKRLEIAGQEYLTSDGSIDLSYLAKIDEKFIHENNLTGSIDSGDRVIIEDDDLGVANEFTVQSISIRHGQKILPTYDIKLANIKASTLRSEFRKSQYNQSSYNYVNSSTVSNTVNNTTTITGGDLEWQILD